MKIVYQQGADIERESMRIIDEELCRRGVCLPLEQEAVIKRVIHATADFDYVQTLSFTEHAAVRARAAFAAGVSLITDTNMALSGLSRPALRKLGMEALCYMADPAVAAEAKERCLTRAAVSMERWQWAMPPRRCWLCVNRLHRASARPWSLQCRWVSSMWWRAKIAFCACAGSRRSPA